MGALWAPRRAAEAGRSVFVPPHEAKLGLGPADRVATRYDLANKNSHCAVDFALGIDGVLVRGGCVSENPEDIAFG